MRDLPASLLFTYPLGEFSAKPRQKAAGTCTFIRGCTSLLCEEELPYTWVDPLLD